jgi:PAS domain S-box-containing protein
MIWFKDTKNRILRVNRRAAEATAKNAEDLQGKSTRDLYPQEAEKYYADDLEVIQTKLPKLGIVETMRDPSGNDRWVQTDKVPVCDENANVTGVVVMAQDITDRKMTCPDKTGPG